MRLCHEQEPMNLPPYKYKNSSLGSFHRIHEATTNLQRTVLANCVELEERRITTLSLYGSQMWLISYVISPYNDPSK